MTKEEFLKRVEEITEDIGTDKIWGIDEGSYLHYIEEYENGKREIEDTDILLTDLTFLTDWYELSSLLEPYVSCFLTDLLDETAYGEE